MWSSQEGSLLLWVWLLSLWSSLVLWMTRRRMRDVVPWAIMVLLGYGAANLTVVARRGRTADSLVVSRLGRLRW